MLKGLQSEQFQLCKDVFHFAAGKKVVISYMMENKRLFQDITYEKCRTKLMNMQRLEQEQTRRALNYK